MPPKPQNQTGANKRDYRSFLDAGTPSDTEGANIAERAAKRRRNLGEERPGEDAEGGNTASRNSRPKAKGRAKAKAKPLSAKARGKRVQRDPINAAAGSSAAGANLGGPVPDQHTPIPSIEREDSFPPLGSHAPTPAPSMQNALAGQENLLARLERRLEENVVHRRGIAMSVDEYTQRIIQATLAGAAQGAPARGGQGNDGAVIQPRPANRSIRADMGPYNNYGLDGKPKDLQDWSREDIPVDMRNAIGRVRPELLELGKEEEYKRFESSLASSYAPQGLRRRGQNYHWEKSTSLSLPFSKGFVDANALVHHEDPDAARLVLRPRSETPDPIIHPQQNGENHVEFYIISDLRNAQKELDRLRIPNRTAEDPEGLRSSRPIGKVIDITKDPEAAPFKNKMKDRTRYVLMVDDPEADRKYLTRYLQLVTKENDPRGDIGDKLRHEIKRDEDGNVTSREWVKDSSASLERLQTQFQQERDARNRRGSTASSGR